MPLGIVQRIKEFITGKKDIRQGTRLVINCEKLENRVALLDNGVLEEYTIERTGTSTIVGSIYKGRVKNIEQGLKAMFIDIGLDKNAFLHFWDAIPSPRSIPSAPKSWCRSPKGPWGTKVLVSPRTSRSPVACSF